MALIQFISSGWLEPPVGTVTILIGVYVIFGCVIILSLILTSSQLANSNVPFVMTTRTCAIIYQHYRFLVDGPGLIKRGYDRFFDGLFEIPRTFRFGQVIICKPELIDELKNTGSAVASPEPWIDQVRAPRSLPT
ncbi:unnamed protein product [Penicillium manginii]